MPREARAAEPLGSILLRGDVDLLPLAGFQLVLRAGEEEFDVGDEVEARAAGGEEYYEGVVVRADNGDDDEKSSLSGGEGNSASPATQPASVTEQEQVTAEARAAERRSRHYFSPSRL